jgi:hypothetical protein
MMDVTNLTGELHHSIETRKQIPACMALQWNETKDETALEKRFGRRHEDRRQVWWLSPDDRKWLRFADRYQFAGVFRLEGTGFQVDHDEGPQAQVVKQQVDVKLRIVDLDPLLPPDESEALAEFK